MKPVVIFRHAAIEGPGFLASFLDEHAIPWQLVKIDADQSVPDSIAEYSGLVLMGGPMSVNDDLPWLPPLFSRIREAMQLDIPVLGHCLGGQLISKALGAKVGRNPIKEIGWGEVTTSDNAEARHWFGDSSRFQVFHWHGETFDLPAGATHLLSSPYCRNQAYSIGKHLAFQCHIEMTANMVKSWCEVGGSEIRNASDSPGVQQPEAIQHDLGNKVAGLQTVARPVYERWIAGLKRQG
ncbi:MAG TPA: type 1 glutamine amidotransferase [Methylophilaceae bacterium]|nr:type 1 glutamine amidotransferase [Methylophilaceae bacterium]